MQGRQQQRPVYPPFNPFDTHYGETYLGGPSSPHYALRLQARAWNEGYPKVREDFTEKDPTLLGPSRGLLRYYEPSDGPSSQAPLQGDNPHLRGGARAVSFRRPIRQSRNLRPEVLPKMFQDSVFKTDTAPVADPFRYKSSDDFDESSLFKSFLFNLP